MDLDNPYYESAYENFEKGVVDSAFLNFSKAKDVFLESHDSLNAANCLVMMALIQEDRGDYYGAQETAISALDYLNAENPTHRIYLSTNYNNLGTASEKLKDHQLAISFYERAIQFSDNAVNTSVYRNNIAISQQYLGNYKDASEIFQEILNQTNSRSIEYARTLSNLMRTRWLEDRSVDASAGLREALNIRKNEDDFWGQNASYAHLFDYYEKTNPDSALYFARQMYATANKINSPSDKLEALKRLITLAPPDSVRYYFQIYQTLNDSVQLAHLAAKNQFAVIRYEVEKNKADNLRLQKDNAEKANKITQQQFVSVTLIFLLLSASFGGRFWYKKRKQRLELEAINSIKSNQLKTSRKVHDVVANGIYRVMSEIENKEHVDRNAILDRLEKVYYKSRDISYEAEEATIVEHTYAQQITELLTSFASAEHKVFIVGNEEQLWYPVPQNIKAEIEHVLQELMVNMRKHSFTDQVILRFESIDSGLKVVYRDWGVGLPDMDQRGNGLHNTVSRIKGVQGDITFANAPGKGLEIVITIPLP